MRKILTATWIVAALFAADTAREQTLQRAIDLMESKGDLAKAMPLLEDVSRSADKSLAARALLYLGQAQERQAAQKARATYERIIREFSGQTESVAVARRRLSALGGAVPSGMLTQRLVCQDCRNLEADITPDGRSMLMTDWDTGDLAIRDFATNHVRRLMVKPGSWADSNAFAETPIFSRDLRQIAYFWDNAEKENGYELRVVANEPGSKPRVLLKTPENNYYEPSAWSTDGKSVLVLLQKADRTWEIAWVSAADGSVKTLKSLQWRIRTPRGRVVLSPDGRYVAFGALAINPKSAAGPVESTETRIYIMAADGSSETAVVKTAGINENPTWTPDGKHLLFNSDRAGSFGLWSVAIENGSAAAPPSLVMPGLGRIGIIGVRRSGSYYYSPNAEDVETVSIAEAGMSHRPAEVSVGVRPTWSPDGTKLAFFRHHPPAGGDSYDLVVHSLATGEEVVYALDRLRPAPARWFHDGQSLLVLVGISGKSRGLLYRLDLNGGKFTQVFASDMVSGVFAVSPNDQTVYLAGRNDKDNRVVMDRILVIDAKTGRQTQTLSIPALGAIGLQLSPDGRTLAILHVDSQAHRARIALMSVDGSGYREIYNFEGMDNRAIDHLGWTQDGRAVLFGLKKDDKWQIMRISTSGGNPEPSEFAVPDAGNLLNISVGPDGKRLAFSAQRNISELWAIDNILSVLK